MTDTLDDFQAFRSRMNDVILGAGNLTINRFFALDGRAYEAGALGVKTNSVKVLLFRARKRLGELLTRKGLAP